MSLRDTDLDAALLAADSIAQHRNAENEFSADANHGRRSRGESSAYPRALIAAPPSPTVTIDHVLQLAAAVKADAMSRRPVSLDTALGHSAMSNDDAFTTADEIAAAFAALEQPTRPELSAGAGFVQQRVLDVALTEAGLVPGCIDELMDAAAGKSSARASPAAFRNNQQQNAAKDSRNPSNRNLASTFSGASGLLAASAPETLTVPSHVRRVSVVSELSAARTPHSATTATLTLGATAASAGLGFDVTALAHTLKRLEEGGDDDDGDDDDARRLDFRQFESALAIDPWLATSARLFLTLGGDPNSATSKAPVAAVSAALTRMLEHEVSQAVIAHQLSQFEQLHERSDGLTFEAFHSTVVRFLRRLCSGDLDLGGAAAAPTSPASKGQGGGGVAGSAGLLKMLTFVPNFGPKVPSSNQVLARLSQIVRDARRSRDRYQRIRARSGTVFQHACILADTPFAHLARLNRRHLLFVANMITQRRSFNLSPPKRVVDAVLRSITAAAQVLREHAAHCTYCRRFDEAAQRPIPSSQATTTGNGTGFASPRSKSPVRDSPRSPPQSHSSGGNSPTSSLTAAELAAKRKPKSDLIEVKGNAANRLLKAKREQQASARIAAAQPFKRQSEYEPGSSRKTTPRVRLAPAPPTAAAASRGANPRPSTARSSKADALVPAPPSGFRTGDTDATAPSTTRERDADAAMASYEASGAILRAGSSRHTEAKFFYALAMRHHHMQAAEAKKERPRDFTF
jgi:hypothetical protein